MNRRFLKEDNLKEFRLWLRSGEKSENTVKKYRRDAVAFLKFLSGGPLTKESVIEYKNSLSASGYSPRGINSMLAGVNSFLVFMGLCDLKVKYIRCDTRLYRPRDRELSQSEYMRLVRAAERKGDERLSLLLQTVCSAGIRISELAFITVEAALKGEAMVSLKGKTRRVFIVKKLRKKLLAYAKKHRIVRGALFLTRGGKPLDRSNVWREMKNLCAAAGVNPKKVFPHNLRHLFAQVFYRCEKDIAKLADILGHSSISTTRIYIASAGNEHRRIMEKMHLLL